jgi:hypothetical protein
MAFKSWFSAGLLLCPWSWEKCRQGRDKKLWVSCSGFSILNLKGSLHHLSWFFVVTAALGLLDKERCLFGFSVFKIFRMIISKLSHSHVGSFSKPLSWTCVTVSILKSSYYCHCSCSFSFENHSIGLSLFFILFAGILSDLSLCNLIVMSGLSSIQVDLSQ